MASPHGLLYGRKTFASTVRCMAFPTFDITLAAVLAVLLLAGLVRGFSGFGTGMVAIPVLAATHDPVTAVVVIAIVDSLPQLPAALPALRYAR